MPPSTTPSRMSDQTAMVRSDETGAYEACPSPRSKRASPYGAPVSITMCAASNRCLPDGWRLVTFAAWRRELMATTVAPRSAEASAISTGAPLIPDCDAMKTVSPARTPARSMAARPCAGSLSSWVLARAACGAARCTAIGHGVMRRGVSQHACTAGGEHLFARLVFDGQHGIGQLTTQSGHVDFGVELAGVENDEVGHTDVLRAGC